MLDQRALPVLILKRGVVLGYRKTGGKRKEEKKNVHVSGFLKSSGPYDYTSCSEWSEICCGYLPV